MTETLGTSDFYDTAAFAVPPTVAPMDAVRKAAARLGTVTGMGETAAMTVAEAVVDLAALRASLNEPLPGLTATSDAHLRVIRTRVWTPWVTPPADQIDRYGSQKIFPLQDPVPKIAQAEGTSDGLVMEWATPTDRDWHLNDNEDIYGRDVYAERTRIFPEKGGIVTPMVLVPQTETFANGSDALHLLRIVDGRHRYYAVQSMLRQFSGLDADSLARHLGPDITLDDVDAALTRDRAALTKVVRAIREACVRAGDGNDSRNLVGVHYLASVISVPAHIIVGTVDPVTTEVTPLGAKAFSTLSIGNIRWHSGKGRARVVSTGQQECNGLLLPQAYIDQEMIDNTARRLRARGVPKNVIEFGTQAPRQAARFVWWCRATAQFNGSPATAVAGFAQQVDGPWPQSISRPLLACAAHLMEEDRDSVYPPGDYRKAETRPDSLSMLVTDAQNLEAVAAVSDDGHGGLLVHPRFRNASHIALAHLALSGALPDKQPLPERIVTHTRLLSQVARSLAASQMPAFVRPSGATYLDEHGQAVVIDERTLSRNDLPWPKNSAPVSYLMPPSNPHPFPQASHVFGLKHNVVYTVPATGWANEGDLEATPEALASVVRRWFPDATGIAFTDWSDKFITGVMVGSVFVRLHDREVEKEEARSHGVWYPEGQPAGTKDVLDFTDLDASAPTGTLIGVGDWLTNLTDDRQGAAWMGDAEEQLFGELDEGIINEADDALEAQKAADKKNDRSAPVLRLPELKEVR